jgi:hypothetical protein
MVSQSARGGSQKVNYLTLLEKKNKISLLKQGLEYDADLRVLYICTEELEM